MKDNLEPNMYVRLNCNYELGIGKTISEIDEDNFIKTKFKDGFECSLPTYMIKKASRNIIDLIQVGDYVNGSKVVNINYDLNYNEDIVESITIFDYSIEGNDILHNEQIKSVVTKDQFESMKYSLGEE